MSHHHNDFFFGFGLPFYGYGFFGYWPYYYYPYYPGYYSSFYNAWPYYDYDPYCYYPLASTYTSSYAVASSSAAQPETDDYASSADSSDSQEAAVADEANGLDSNEFARQGEAAFKRGDYDEAVHEWRHAVLDDPKNGILVMRLAQALFATGAYEEAAGATQQAMLILPQDKWGTVISGYSVLYGNTQDYTDQLRALEKAVNDNPKDPAMRFLLGFQYGYLGYPAEATRELDELVMLAPQDQLGRKLHDLMADRAKNTPAHFAPAAEVKPRSGAKHELFAHYV
jgi:tetratricopeptide (TPR) repeat protein